MLLLQSIRHVVAHRHVREEGVVLEHGVDLAPVGGERRDVRAVEHDRAVVGKLEARDQSQGRRLAATGRSEQRVELAGAHA
jgi:hypothetical protein